MDRGFVAAATNAYATATATTVGRLRSRRIKLFDSQSSKSRSENHYVLEAILFLAHGSIWITNVKNAGLLIHGRQRASNGDLVQRRASNVGPTGVQRRLCPSTLSIGGTRPAKRPLSQRCCSWVCCCVIGNEADASLPEADVFLQLTPTNTEVEFSHAAPGNTLSLSAVTTTINYHSRQKGSR